MSTTHHRVAAGEQPVHAVRIPADVERQDRVLANLTARQLAILTAAGLLLYAAYAATRPVLPPVVFAAIAVPVALAAAILALGSRDGLSLDRLLAAAVRQRLTPRVQIAAPGGIIPAPAWVTAHATSDPTSTGRVTPSALDLPARSVTDSAAGSAGVIDLGADGLAAVCVCSTLNFALRTPAEQEGLVASFGRYLHSLTAPVQILIRAQRLDLTGQIADLRDRAGGLAHPALEQAALEHADYLTQLAENSDLLRRQVLLVLREPLHPGSPFPAHPALSTLRRRAGRRPRAGHAARHAAETRLARRISEVSGLLSTAGIVATPLDAARASAVLAAACNPESLIPPTADLAGPDAVITTTPAVEVEEAEADSDPRRAPAAMPFDPYWLATDATGDSVAEDESWWAR
ncbi:PrgI family protein [Jatrophihabitans lederbergiae]|uniref:PrgI family protein n=1 Tax=Jatrophihabitans lederbergiae TaxID=3075547 RepID=A0ABU2JGL0_9ACTN|nr:PrgI family protein [Jatrophihabitans sp. DSM 44399]MDT0264122.1 PrgI family protein [Jatrophihabitans sp. DSM 44399]